MAKKHTPASTTARKPKQTEIQGEGFKPKTIPQIEEAAEEYVELRDNRMAIQEKETAASERLTFLLHQHKLTCYRYDGKLVTLVPTEKVKVKTDKDES
jgi:hypothetical protein